MEKNNNQGYLADYQKILIAFLLCFGWPFLSGAALTLNELGVEPNALSQYLHNNRSISYLITWAGNGIVFVYGCVHIYCKTQIKLATFYILLAVIPIISLLFLMR